jgi:hypothetical protein
VPARSGGGQRLSGALTFVVISGVYASTLVVDEGALAPVIMLVGAVTLGLCWPAGWIWVAAALPVMLLIAFGSDINETPGFYVPIAVGIAAFILLGVSASRFVAWIQEP